MEGGGAVHTCDSRVQGHAIHLCGVGGVGGGCMHMCVYVCITACIHAC